MLNFNQRLSHKLSKRGIPVIPTIFRIINFLIFHCDIPPATVVGNDVVFTHHGLGVVINGLSTIGDHTRISPNVTIGGSGKKREIDGAIMEAPIIGKNVIIGAGSQVIGPIFIGDGAIIGAGSVVTKDVAPNITVAGNPARKIGS